MRSFFLAYRALIAFVVVMCTTHDLFAVLCTDLLSAKVTHNDTVTLNGVTVKADPFRSFYIGDVQENGVRRIHVVSYDKAGVRQADLVKKADAVVLERENFGLYHVAVVRIPEHFQSVHPSVSAKISDEFVGSDFYTAPVVRLDGRRDWDLFKASEKRGIERSGRMYLRIEAGAAVKKIDESKARLFKNSPLGKTQFLVLLDVKHGDETIELIFTVNSRPERLDAQANAYGRHLLRLMGLGGAVTYQLRIYGEGE